MRFHLLLFVSIVGLCSGHDEYHGSCPVLTPMSGFNWDKFRDGKWFATEKFDTSSKCLTYEFKEDEDGDFLVEQTSVLTGLRRVSVDNKVKYRGRLAAPYVSEPANMLVRFTLNPFGSASFVVMDTDYDNYALICTCQSKKFLFEVLTFHRRSCTILQRSPERDTAISRKLHDLLNEQIPGDDDELPDHDFDVVTHTGCDYEDNGKGLQLDVEKILGTSQKEIGDTVRGIVSQVDELLTNKEREELTNTNLPYEEEEPGLLQP